MSFVLSEISKGSRRYTISQKVESPTGNSWVEIATFTKRATAFFYISFVEKMFK